MGTKQHLRQAVFERDGYMCRYCGNKVARPHADHVYPASKGGETSMANMVTACPRCNTSKSDKIGVWPQSPGYTFARRALIIIGLVCVAVTLPAGVLAQMWLSTHDMGLVPLMNVLVPAAIVLWPIFGLSAHALRKMR